MRRLASIIAIGLMAAPAAAQEYAGNWLCYDGAGRIGLMTLYAGSYGFASRTFQDPASGTGSYTAYTDGAGLIDGNLRAKLGVEAARLVTATTGGVALQLETGSAVVMLCTPR